MRPKPDNRKNNVQRIQKNINWTIHNMELADDLIKRTPDEKMKKTLADKNERRRDALDGFRKEIKDEAKDRENGYK